jgi:AmmeMemoRadiSam system protein A
MTIPRLLASLALLGILLVCTAPASWGEEPMSLTASDREVLLKLARDSIRVHFKGESLPPLKNPAPILCELRGAFVSLHRQGQLRGCIGYLQAVRPLEETVVEMAAAAAFHDPRFAPLREEELGDLEVEISVLTPMKLISSVDDIQVGKHGLYIERGSNRGLLLPQVAAEYKWNRQTFLEQTCCKAGLPPDAWKDPASKIYTFAAEVFSDQPHPDGRTK